MSSTTSRATTPLFEREPLESLAADGQLVGVHHHGFWQPMDTLRDVRILEALWESGDAPWAVWQDRAPTHPARADEPD